MHKFLSFLICTSLVGMTSMYVNARTLSPEEALGRLDNSRMLRKLGKQKSAIRLIKTINSTTSDEETLYIFGTEGDNGYMVASADDMFPTLLGYSNEGTISEEDMPPALSWWLEQLSGQIQYARDNANLSTEDLQTSASSEAKEAIEPLLKSKWNQDAPFNNLVPTTTANGRTKSATGCVATAMAQLMYYYKYPEVGIGTISYSYTRSDNTTNTLTADLATMPFDWGNMLDSYSGNYTEEQANAVANLMYACGLSVGAKYASTTSASTITDVVALCENFGYSTAMRYYYRDYTPSSIEWENLVYGSLSRGCPVIYSGASTSGGHSFLCDGYSGDGYYHFNWGWSGKSDGYFLLYLLNPKDQGIGGTGSGYNDRGMIITDIHPARDGEAQTYQPGIMAYNGDFDYRNGAFCGTDPTGSSNGFYNKSPQTINIYYGLLAYDSNGQEYELLKSTLKEYAYNKGVGSMSYSTLNLPDGVYDVYPAFRITDEEKARKMMHDNGYNDHLVVTVTNKNFTTAWPEYKAQEFPEMIISAFQAAGPVLSNTESSWNISATNLSETQDYYGNIKIKVLDSEGTEVYETSIFQSLNASATMDFTTSLKFDLEPGNYKVMFTNPAGVPMTNITYPLTIIDATVTGEGLGFVSLSTSTFEPQTAPQRLTLSLKNTSGARIEITGLRINLYDDNRTLLSTSSNFSFNTRINNNNTGNFNFSNPEILKLDAGNYYIEFTKAGATDNSIDVAVTPLIPISVQYTVESVEFAVDTLELEVGNSTEIKTSVSPSTIPTDALRWHSENSEVADVDQTGNVTAKASGETYIYAITPNGPFARVLVKVAGSSGISESFTTGFALTPTAEGFRVSGVDSPVKVTVYSADGMKVLPEIMVTEDTHVDMTQYAAGIYFVKAVKDGNTVSLKIIR